MSKLKLLKFNSDFWWRIKLFIIVTRGINLEILVRKIQYVTDCVYIVLIRSDEYNERNISLNSFMMF